MILESGRVECVTCGKESAEVKGVQVDSRIGIVGIRIQCQQLDCQKKARIVTCFKLEEEVTNW